MLCSGNSDDYCSMKVGGRLVRAVGRSDVYELSAIREAV